MKLYIAGVLLALAHLADSDDDANSRVDRLVHIWNQYASGGFETVQIPRMEWGFIHFEEGILYGLNSLYRIGDVVVKEDPQGHTYDLHVGFAMMEMAFGRSNFSKEHPSAIFRIEDNSLHIRVSYNVNNTYRCFFTFNNVQWDRFSNITLISADPFYDGVLSKSYEDLFINKTNYLLHIAAHVIESVVERDLCERRYANLQDPNMYQDITNFINSFTQAII